MRGGAAETSPGRSGGVSIEDFEEGTANTPSTLAMRPERGKAGCPPRGPEAETESEDRGHCVLNPREIIESVKCEM